MSLEDLILARIRQDGPISVASYMSDCLLHPEYGYYTTRHPFGRSGDFITAPEISQMFGELIGLSLAQSWLDQGQPKRFTLAEPGPGRGTLMADLLRATRKVPGFHDAARVTLIEASTALRELQASTLENYDPAWIDRFDDLPDQPLFLIANEFFDALPIRQFIRDGDEWGERQVGLHDEKLAFGLTEPTPFPALSHRLKDTKPGDLVETSPQTGPIITTIAERIAAFGGAAVIVDYGDWRSLGDTLQAVKGHKSVDPLSTPGLADLTAHVDFEPVATAARAAGCSHTRLTPQGVFLERLGITERTKTLATSVEKEALETLVNAHRRLTHPEEMGNLFKTLGLYPLNCAPPPGLDP